MSVQCVYGFCKSNSKFKQYDFMKDVQFLQFPNPKENLLKCERWARACGLPGFSYSKVTKDTYICSNHFLDGIPTRENPNPIPFSQVGDHCYTGKLQRNPFRCNKTCSVPLCNGRPNSEVSIHSFPTNPSYKEKWIKAFSMKKIPKQPFACSQHFKKDDFFVQNSRSLRRRLKINAVPSKNLPDSTLLNIELRKNWTKPSARDFLMKNKMSTDNDCNETKPDLSMVSFTEEIIENLSEAAMGVNNDKLVKPPIFKGRKGEKRNTGQKKNMRPKKTPRKKWATNGEEPSNRYNEEIKDVEDVISLYPMKLKGSVAMETEIDAEQHFNPKTKALQSQEPSNRYNEEIKDVENVISLYPMKLKGSVAMETEIDAEQHFNPKTKALQSPILSIMVRIHVPDFIDCEERPVQKGCVVCNKKILLKEVCTFCPDCADTPPLCLQPCFRQYHGY